MYKDKFEFYSKKDSPEFKLALEYTYELNRIDNSVFVYDIVLKDNLTKEYANIIKTNNLDEIKYNKYKDVLNKWQPEDIEYLYANIN